MRLLFPGVCVEGKRSEWQSAVGPSPSVKSTFSNRLLSCHQRRPNDQGRFGVAVRRTLASRRFDYLTHCLARAHQRQPPHAEQRGAFTLMASLPNEERKTHPWALCRPLGDAHGSDVVSRGCTHLQLHSAPLSVFVQTTDEM